MCTYVRMYVCVYICPWSGPPGAREERKRLSEPSWSPNKCVCVCALWMRVLATSSSGSPPNWGLRASPKPSPSRELVGPPYPRGSKRAGVRDAEAGVRFSTSSPRSASRHHGSQGAPASTPTPSSQPLPPLPRRAEHRQGHGGLAPKRAPPAVPAGHGRSWPGAAAAASTAARSLPASGQHRPRALQSMSHHRPGPGLRLCTARAGAAVQAPAPAGSGHSSRSGFASAPRSRSRSV